MIQDETDTKIFLSVLHIVREATRAHHCRWFGNSEDITKMLSKLIPSESNKWTTAEKPSSLARLLLLSKHDNIPIQIRNEATYLFHLVCASSGLYEGHGIYELELQAEQSAWSQTFTVVSPQDTSILAADCVMRVAAAWNAEYCMHAYKIVSNSGVVSVIEEVDKCLKH